MKKSRHNKGWHQHHVSYLLKQKKTGMSGYFAWTKRGKALMMENRIYGGRYSIEFAWDDNVVTFSTPSSRCKTVGVYNISDGYSVASMDFVKQLDKEMYFDVEIDSNYVLSGYKDPTVFRLVPSPIQPIPDDNVYDGRA